MKLRRILTFGFLLVVLVAASASAITVRLGSIAPRQSVYGEALEQLAGEWSRITNGQVTLRVFHNGIAGDMGDMVRKMRIRQLDAGVFVSSGMSVFTEKIMAYSMPFLIRDDAELSYVLGQTKSYLEGLIAERGFKILAWSQAGWVKFFGREPIVYPDDLRGMRIATNPDEPELLRMWQILGFNAIGVNLSETLGALNSGMVNAIYSNAIGAAAYQWFGITDHMTDMNISPFLGAIVMDMRTWNRIPDQFKPALERSLEETQQGIDDEVARLEEEAVRTMQRFGLDIVDVPSAAERAWRREVEESLDATVGGVFDRDMYERIVRHLENFRSR